MSKLRSIVGRVFCCSIRHSALVSRRSSTVPPSLLSTTRRSTLVCCGEQKMLIGQIRRHSRPCRSQDDDSMWTVCCACDHGSWSKDHGRSVTHGFKRTRDGTVKHNCTVTLQYLTVQRALRGNCLASRQRQYEMLEPGTCSDRNTLTRRHYLQ